MVLGTFLYTLTADATTCVGDFIKDEDSRVWDNKVIRKLRTNYATCLDSFNYWDVQPEGDCEVAICAYTCLAHCVVDAVRFYKTIHNIHYLLIYFISLY